MVEIHSLLRSLLGEALSVKLVSLVSSNIMKTCRLWNLYGPAETTIDCAFHLVDADVEGNSVPIGRPLPGYSCVILDDFSQPVFVGQEGELLVGGVGVFAGYLGRDDLTKKALVEIDGQVFYRTGDLVRFDNSGVLHYEGRKDHQIKLRGQRIELGEIERCLLDVSSKVSGCVVVKWGEDHLVAYVQSDGMEEEQLREHCRSHLAPFMVPSMFIVLEQLPLNANGKLDRKRLPTPDFSRLSLSGQMNRHVEPRDELETRIHSLWCEVLQCSPISTIDSIFTIGGHSLTLMQLYHRYKSMFDFDRHAVGITQMFQHPTIVDHARYIRQSLNTESCQEEPWLPLNITRGKCSYRVNGSDRLCLGPRYCWSVM